MLFQTLDDKGECIGIYHDGELLFDFENFPQDLTRTWGYNSFLEGYRGVDYAELYALGQSLDEACPDHLKEEWQDLRTQRSSLIRSLAISKVSLQENCLFDVLPPWFLKKYCEAKNQISNYVIESRPKPPNYKHLFSVARMLADIKEQELSIDTSCLKKQKMTPVIANLLKKVSSCSPYVVYNQFGTITGRLTTKPTTFPILTIKKEHREILKPTNDFFLELDFNGAEIRVLLGLLGLEQPKQDIHQWNLENIFDNELDRPAAKEAFFAWLYGSHSSKLAKYVNKLNNSYDKQTLVNDYWDGEYIRTPFARDIKSDQYHALNYLIQSTAADLALEQAVKIKKLLRGRKTKISFIIHDSIVLDFSSEDKELFNELGLLMGDTRFGKFLVSANIGKNFADLKEAKAFV